MAENAMQGIMGLDEARAMPSMPPPIPPTPQPTPEQMAAFEQARLELDPRDVTRELLSAGEEIDPGAVQELRRELAGLQLPPELIGAMLTMVEMILAEPGRYAEMRQELIMEGVPEDLLPAQFDAEYFGSLELALEQLDTQLETTMPPVGSMQPMRFANGGVVSMTPIAKELQSYGRNGDTILAHINPQEARMLKRMGGSGTINPVTGLPEFFLGGVVKGIGNAFKGAAKAVGGAVKGLAKGVQKFAKSPIGKIAIGTALFFIAGPAAASLFTSAAGAAAFQGVVAGFGASILGGDNLKTSLRNGAIGGVTAGAMAGITGGAAAFESGSYTGAKTYGELFNNAKSGIGSLFGQDPATEAFPVTGGTNVAGQPLPPIEAPTLANVTPTGAVPGAPTSLNIPVPSAPPVVAPSNAPTGFFDTIKSGVSDFTGGVKDFFTPGSGVDPSKVADAAFDSTYKSALKAGLSDAAATVKAQGAFDTALAGATPSALSKYAPYVAGGLGIMQLTGGFEEQPAEQLDLMANYTSGSDLLAQYPEKYGVNLGPVETTYATPTGDPNDAPYQDFYASMAQNPYMQQNPYAAQQPTAMLAGGGPANSEDFPRRNGPINGPGTGKSDSIPAMLSDGEFVFTAKAVRGAGNGSRRDGAKQMYRMMKQFEGNA